MPPPTPAQACAHPAPPAGEAAGRGWVLDPVGPELRGAGPPRLGGDRGGRGAVPGSRGRVGAAEGPFGAQAVLSRAALARAAAVVEEEEEEGSGGGGESRGKDGGGVGLEPSGGASCPGRGRVLARRAPTPDLHPAVPSSARVRAPAGSAPGLPPE